MLYTAMVKSLLFKMSPERAHNIAAAMISGPFGRMLAQKMAGGANADLTGLESSLCGISLRHPIGLAAGFDKNATMYPNLDGFGFAFAEIGTVTGVAQEGNPKPRLFRLVEDEALINRMGFNNQGAEIVARRLARKKARIPLGGNIGKSKVVSLEEAPSDYLQSFRLLQPYVDYFVVNVSSPNTPNLRKLQEKGPLLDLLQRLGEANHETQLPLLLKIAPDLNHDQLDDVMEVVTRSGVNGVIATNTTIAREGLRAPNDWVASLGAGGLSGRPLTQRATEVIRYLRRGLPDHVDIVGVGGIFSGEDVYEKLKAGAACVQIYTSFIYRGPTAVFSMLRELKACMARDGVVSLKDLAAGC